MEFSYFSQNSEFLLAFPAQDFGQKLNMERYRSGHNGADSKSVWEQSHMGSNPILSAIKDLTFVYHDKSGVFPRFGAFLAKSKQNTGKLGPRSGQRDCTEALFLFSEPKIAKNAGVLFGGLYSAKSFAL